RVFGRLYEGWRRVVALVDPRSQYDWGGHGFAGWQTTSFIDPLVIAGIASGDRTFRWLLFRVILFLLRLQGLFTVLKQAVLRLGIVRYLDPNFRDARGAHGQLAFIPIGTDGKRRTGVREHLLATAREHPDRLLLRTGAFVSRVIFDRADEKGPPRAIGVSVVERPYVYEASPLSANPRKGTPA